MIERYTKPGLIARIFRWFFDKKSNWIAYERVQIAIGRDRYERDCEQDLLQRGRH